MSSNSKQLVLFSTSEPVRPMSGYELAQKAAAQAQAEAEAGKPRPQQQGRTLPGIK